MRNSEYGEHSPHDLPSPLRSSRRLSCGLDEMIASMDGSASVGRASFVGRASVSDRKSITESSISGLPGSEGQISLQELDKNVDEDDGDAAPSEAEKTMTALGGTTLLCKSMMGGGAPALLQSVAFARIVSLILSPQECSVCLTAAQISALC
jgi:hypothetical protein